MKSALLVVLLLLHISALWGQQQLAGSVIDSAFSLPLKNVTVQNHTLNTKTLSDAEGKFSIAAQRGHSISFSLFAHQTQTVVLNTLDPLKIILSPKVNLLQEVEVRHLNTSPSTWQSPAFRGQSMVYTKEYDDPSAGGVVFRVWYWKKDEKRRNKRLEAERIRSVEGRIRDIFSPLNISLYVPLRGEDLNNFIWHYTPSPETFTHPNFELLLYLNDSYKKFQQLPASDKKIPELMGR
ncbi:carboxypeptidase-like regulatory domain-containing protein [Arcticibacter sp.]|uniref:carboxypeptidase-like regulatory domain-containing protein n=1 Tax=Arcticibacter sp. TaxID=1872630 RepID=UPI00388EE288